MISDIGKVSGNDAIFKGKKDSSVQNLCIPSYESSTPLNTSVWVQKKRNNNEDGFIANKCNLIKGNLSALKMSTERATRNIHEIHDLSYEKIEVLN